MSQNYHGLGKGLGLTNMFNTTTHFMCLSQERLVIQWMSLFWCLSVSFITLYTNLDDSCFICISSDFSGVGLSQFAIYCNYLFIMDGLEAICRCLYFTRFGCLYHRQCHITYSFSLYVSSNARFYINFVNWSFDIPYRNQYWPMTLNELLSP